MQKLETAGTDKLRGKTLNTLPLKDYHLPYMCQVCPRFRSKLDGFVPQTRGVNLRIVS